MGNICKVSLYKPESEMCQQSDTKFAKNGNIHVMWTKGNLLVNQAIVEKQFLYGDTRNVYIHQICFLGLYSFKGIYTAMYLVSYEWIWRMCKALLSPKNRINNSCDQRISSGQSKVISKIAAGRIFSPISMDGWMIKVIGFNFTTKGRSILNVEQNMSCVR